MGTAFAATDPALAHGFAGKRFFPATLATDDPFVADELSLPTISSRKLPPDGDNPATRETDFSIDVSKRVTDNLGIGFGATYKRLAPDGGDAQRGFDNLAASVKYKFYQSDEHETILSAGIDWDIGNSGSKRVGAESFSTFTPTLFFGKGFGDLPEALDAVKPVALTGTFGVALPTRRLSHHLVTEDDGTISLEREVNPVTAKWGFSVQYNLQYLQSYVKDVGLPAPLNRMIPIVEVAMQTPLDAPTGNGRVTGTINPGIIWFGRYLQLGLEAVIPMNERSGKNVGVIGQLHFYLDDIAPKIFSWTPFHGVLGPTQPR